jgi:probable HAF family extracellular repeat protein
MDEKCEDRVCSAKKEKTMKSRIILMWFTAITLFAALAIPVQLAAQEQKKEHSRYKLIDLGTLGGPHSYGSVNGDGFILINNSGVVAAYADTALPDPNAPNSCVVPDCFLTHAFRWKDGVKTDLGALPGMNSSAAGSINAGGWITGQSQKGSEGRAVLWKHNQILDLGTLGGGNLRADAKTTSQIG